MGRSRRIVWTTVVTCLVVIAGCRQRYEGPRRGAVQGKITLDGQVVKEGAITFTPVQGRQGPTAGGDIVDGVYDIPESKGPVVGKSRVAIRAPVKTGKMIPAPPVAGPAGMMDEILESIPPQFNEQTILIKDISSGDNTIDFELLTAEGS